MLIDRRVVGQAPGAYLGSFAIDVALTFTVNSGATYQHRDLSAWYTGGYGALGSAATIDVTTSLRNPNGGYTEVDSDTLTYPTVAYQYDAPSSGGQYAVAFNWNWSGGETWYEYFTYYVTGGTGAGTQGIIAITAYERPEKQHVVYETRSGLLIAKQGPS